MLIRVLMERLEELIDAQYKIASLMLSPETKGSDLSTSTAFDVLYVNLEMLDLTSNIIGMTSSVSDEYIKKYAISLGAEALSWSGFMLTHIEKSSPIFIEYIEVENEPVTYRIKNLAYLLENMGSKLDPFSFEEIIRTIDMVSKAIRYQIYMAKKSYETME
ncbi:MAG: hypothetical protein ACK4SM_02670 [Aquificaceae bacterium]